MLNKLNPFLGLHKAIKNDNFFFVLLATGGICVSLLIPCGMFIVWEISLEDLRVTFIGLLFSYSANLYYWKEL